MLSFYETIYKFIQHNRNIYRTRRQKYVWGYIWRLVSVSLLTGLSICYFLNIKLPMILPTTTFYLFVLQCHLLNDYNTKKLILIDIDNSDIPFLINLIITIFFEGLIIVLFATHGSTSLLLQRMIMENTFLYSTKDSCLSCQLSN